MALAEVEKQQATIGVAAGDIAKPAHSEVRIRTEIGDEDAVIEVVMSLDEESEKALRVAWRAAEKLLHEYGIVAVVVPRVEYWGYAPPGYLQYPRIYVNGELVAVGDEDLDEETIIDAVLALLGEKHEQGDVKEFAPTSRTFKELVEAGATAA